MMVGEAFLVVHLLLGGFGSEAFEKTVMGDGLLGIRGPIFVDAV
jgi:hypothetical protein